MVAAFASVVTIVLAIVACVNRPKQRSVAELPAPSEAVRILLQDGNTIAAIRAYRGETSTSLFEATRVIENCQASAT